VKKHCVTKQKELYIILGAGFGRRCIGHFRGLAKKFEIH